mmetsp:Transcript_21337/g.49642  ORF Transcript_21337/g.49642 Transcript_21337/m.49642 type:complete len:245 (+) Transcript_21337:1413-2147(+)
MSGDCIKILLMPIRTFQPPEKRPTFLSKSSGMKPASFAMLSTMSSSLSTSNSSFRVCSSVNLMRRRSSSCLSSGLASNASETSFSSSRTAFCSGKAAKSSSLSVRSGLSSSTKLCSRMATLASGGLLTTSPFSGVSWPSSTRSCVVFPQPFAPTSANFSPVFTVQEASCRTCRPPRRTATSRMPTMTSPSTFPFCRKLKSTWSSAPRVRLIITGSSSSSSSGSSYLGSFAHSSKSWSTPIPRLA